MTPSEEAELRRWADTPGERRIKRLVLRLLDDWAQAGKRRKGDAERLDALMKTIADLASGELVLPRRTPPAPAPSE